MKLKINWKADYAEDLGPYKGPKLEYEIVDYMANEIAKDIDRQIFETYLSSYALNMMDEK